MVPDDKDVITKTADAIFKKTYSFLYTPIILVSFGETKYDSVWGCSYGLYHDERRPRAMEHFGQTGIAIL